MVWGDYGEVLCEVWSGCEYGGVLCEAWSGVSMEVCYVKHGLGCLWRCAM